MSYMEDYLAVGSGRYHTSGRYGRLYEFEARVFRDPGSGGELWRLHDSDDRYMGSFDWPLEKLPFIARLTLLFSEDPDFGEMDNFDRYDICSVMFSDVLYSVILNQRESNE
jgi:hypothetical protein